MTLIIFALSFAALLVGAYLTPDQSARITRLGLALLAAAIGLLGVGK